VRSGLYHCLAAREGLENVIPLKDDPPSRRTPLVTYALIAANLAAFGWQVLGVGLEASVQRGGAIPYEILTLQDVEWRAVVPPPLTAFTSMFLHGGLGHLAMNMLSLWIFGNSVENALGRVRFLAFYLASGVVAALAQTLAAAVSGDVLVPMVGASGAIAGVLAAYLALFPHARVLSVRLLQIPASFFIGVWFVLQILSVVFGSDPGVAFMAHIGGFVAGLLLVRILGRHPGWRARRVSG
jgi:membrane associated rhomboid family serine protease